MLEEQKSRASEAARQYRQAVAGVQGDTMLSAVGKAQRIAALQGEYNSTIARLQGEARAAVARQREGLDGALLSAIGKRAAALAGIVGEQVRFAILLEAVRELSPYDFVDFASNAPDDWSRAVLIELGRARFSDVDEPEHFRAQRRLAELDGASPWGREVHQVGEQVRGLAEAEQAIPGLDVVNTQHEFAARMGVRADLLPE